MGKLFSYAQTLRTSARTISAGQWGSWQAITGAVFRVIGKSLGHKSQAATAIYARLHLDPVRKSMETATAAMLNAAQQGEKPL
ncbi:MAG: hypothetical protein R3F28_18620 [Candidatus Kapaibacterium sp.]